ncbi:MAG: hypothetical protein HFE90_10155 [Firmicutes bacterium]|nr:hypothetical protein [Bacillota bacterium]
MAANKTRGKVAEKLAAYYRHYYDVYEQEDLQVPLIMRCDLHVNNQKYILFKENIIWEANCHEYVYIFSVEKLTEELYYKCREFVYSEGMKLINPVKDHMYTYLTCVIIADEAEPEAVRALKKCRIRKNFRFSLHGWMELHTALFDCSSRRVTSNRQGREHAKALESVCRE